MNFFLPKFFLPMLTLIFITLKLTEQITWSWLWVLAPWWISLVIVLLIMTVVGVAKVIQGK